MLNYVINERLKKIVEPANILEPGRGGGRQGCCVGINMQKVHFIQQEARRQGKRVYRVDVDFKNAFNAMFQAALWQVMRMFQIPDVDLLEQIYEGATVRLAPNDEESATITFNTGLSNRCDMPPVAFGEENTTGLYWVEQRAMKLLKGLVVQSLYCNLATWNVSCIMENKLIQGLDPFYINLLELKRSNRWPESIYGQKKAD